MNGRMRYATLLAAGAVVALTVGCAKLPEADVAEAKAAIDIARQAGAQSYAVKTMGAAESELSTAMALIGKEQRKLALFRNYDPAREKLMEVKNLADKAKVEADVAARKAQIEAQKAEMEKSVKKTTRKKARPR